MTTIEIFDVGGFVRDALLGIPSKDRDCTVVIDRPGLTVDEGLAILRSWLDDNGFTIFVDTPEHATIRALPPRGGAFGALATDLVLARTEGPYSDGRRPDWVRVGTLTDDLARRDFTVNALARTLDGEIIDHHNGLADLAARRLRFVGDPLTRIREDALRVMRGIRFAVTKGFILTDDAVAAICNPDVPELLAGISEERRELELRTMFANAETVDVLAALESLPADLRRAMFAGRVRLTATLRK